MVDYPDIGSEIHEPGWEELYERALSLGRAKRYAESRDLLARALAMHPEHVRARYNLGVCHFHTGEYAEGMAVFAALADECPNDADIHANLGRLCFKKGDFEKAEADLKKALAINADHAEALRWLGTLMGQRKGDYDSAVALFERSLALDGRSVHAHLAMAICRHHQNNIDAAVRHLKAAIELHPDIGAAHNHLGILYMKLQKEDLAERHFTRAVELDPKNNLKHRNLWDFL